MLSIYKEGISMKKCLLVIVLLVLITGCSKTTSNDTFEELKLRNNELISDIKNADELLIGSHDVNLYLFYLDTCPHCHNEITWLDSIKDNYPYLHIYKYEVTKNKNLYDRVSKKLNIDSEYVPITIVGDKYKVGFSESTKESIINLVKEYSKSEYEDKVQEIVKNK